MLNFIKKYLSCPTCVFSAITLISLFSLGAAYIAQYVFGLAPCPLCLYQRIPFALVILFGVTGILLRKNERISLTVIGLSGLAFLANSFIAFYHSGVERHWWRSAIEGCLVSFDDDPESMLDKILSTPTARCDEIPWADPILGLSMANYNVVLCFGLFVLCLLGLTLLRQRRANSEQTKR